MACSCQQQPSGLLAGPKAVPPIRTGDMQAPKGGGAGILILAGGILAAWAAWAILTPHKEQRGG